MTTRVPNALFFAGERIQLSTSMDNLKRNTFDFLRIFLFLCVGALAATEGWANTILSVGDPTTNWNVVNFTNLNDPINDQQTGQGDADIVGNALNPGFYSNFDGTYVYYRVRLGKTDLQ